MKYWFSANFKVTAMLLLLELESSFENSNLKFKSFLLSLNLKVFHPLPYVLRLNFQMEVKLTRKNVIFIIRIFICAAGLKHSV